MFWFGVVAACILVGAAFLWGPIVSSRVEQPPYTVAKADGAIELRDYASMIVAETEVTGARQAAINQGFRIIADYIFGNNASSQKLAMTAPVLQQSGTKIAMTAPVTQQGEGDRWRVRFIMPAGYTLASLPKPHNPAVQLIEVPARRIAAIRFSGLAGEDQLAQQTTLLNAYLQTQHLTASASPVYAFYNPPWTLPFLRRNEVLLEVAQ